MAEKIVNVLLSLLVFGIGFYVRYENEILRFIVSVSGIFIGNYLVVLWKERRYRKRNLKKDNDETK